MLYKQQYKQIFFVYTPVVLWFPQFGTFIIFCIINLYIRKFSYIFCNKDMYNHTQSPEVCMKKLFTGWGIVVREPGDHCAG